LVATEPSLAQLGSHRDEYLFNINFLLARPKALLLAALAYTYARKRAGDPNFTFGTGKFGDLAGFTSAIILGLIAV
jgi:hypothetical protein